MLKLNKEELQDYWTASQREWIETNGLGGWASSSVIGAHTRRYHGLLVAAIVPPEERMVLVSKLEETIQADGLRYELGCNLFPGNTLHPHGQAYLASFSKGLYPQWIYQADGFRLKKTVAMVHGENTTLVVYEVLKAKSAFTLELLPLMAARGYHSLNHAGSQIHWDAAFNDGIFHNRPDGKLNVFIKAPGTSYQHKPVWFYNFQYNIEQYRGLDFSEDLLSHGVFSIELGEGDCWGIIISTEDPSLKDASDLLKKETERRNLLLKNVEQGQTAKQLVLAADQFIVRRDQDLKTIIAGYHWFTDWGRDTMISLPGLCLATGRFEDAKKILAAFARRVDRGMLPNRFQDNGKEPEYNNVDGTLWYFIAVYKYLKATNNLPFVLQEILPVLKDIINWHHMGTRFHIHEEVDGLLYSGEEGVQLTWMDAKIGDWVVTPRTGKAIEIQALWYNALNICAELLELNNEKMESKMAVEKAGLVKENFLKQFWNKEKGYCYDVIDGEIKDPSLRPNQLFAISLPFPLLEGLQAQSVLKIVEEKLYTPVGLRSLPVEDPRYIGNYGGDALQRDSGYHQGTVWSWLLGVYVDAIFRIYGSNGNSRAKKVIKDFKYHIKDAGVGTVSEIFDGNEPHNPRGCIAQAWGVAEVLRILIEYDLDDMNKQNGMMENENACHA